jgi:hypothetical protein
LGTGFIYFYHAGYFHRLCLMKAGPVTITIPQPCNQDWADMQPVEGGRFCGSCRHAVVDFTRMTDQEILAAFTRHSPCGRFRADQLERVIAAPATPAGMHWLPRWALSLLLLAGAASEGKSQGLKKDSVQVEQAVPQSDLDFATLQEETNIFGTVKDAQLGELINAQVVLYAGDHQIARALTDYDGRYKLTFSPPPDSALRLEISYQSQAETIHGPFKPGVPQNVYFRPLGPDACTILTYVGRPMIRRHLTPWQKAKRKVRNLFR